MPAVSFASTPFLTGPSLPAGCWRLPAGRAISLYPDRSGWVHVVQGRVWATLDGPHAGPEADLFLKDGDHLLVKGGQRVVIEPFGAGGLATAAAFDWRPADGRRLSPWALAVAEPVADLRRALAGAAIGLRAAAQALGRLMAGVAGLVFARPLRSSCVVVRGRALAPDEQALSC